jgi:hypothetical protein
MWQNIRAKRDFNPHPGKLYWCKGISSLETNESPMSLNERRVSPRVKLDHLVNLNLHSGNAGIVLDFSNSGLASATRPSEFTSRERHSLKIYWHSGRRLRVQ